jgi:hypothetical protein
MAYDKEWYLTHVKNLSFGELKQAIKESTINPDIKKTFMTIINSYEEGQDEQDLLLIQERFAGWLANQDLTTY